MVLRYRIDRDCHVSKEEAPPPLVPLPPCQPDRRGTVTLLDTVALSSPPSLFVSVGSAGALVQGVSR